MDISLLALWFVCGLGAVVFAAAGVVSRPGVIAGVAGFALGLWWVQQPVAPAPAVIGLGAALLGAFELIRKPQRPAAMAAAGVLAGLWTGVLQFQGLPLTAAVPIAASVPVASGYLRLHRPEFAPPALREEALLFVIVVGVVAAAAPTIGEGWRAATNLNLQGGESEPAVLPMWTLLVASAALVSGGLFSLWSRR